MMPENALELFNEANEHARHGRLNNACKKYKQALQLQPDFAEVHNKLGSALVKQGDFLDGVSHLQKALALKPNYREAFEALAQTLFFLAEREYAPKILKEDAVIRQLIVRAKAAWPERLPPREILSDPSFPLIAANFALLFFLGSIKLCDDEVEQALTSLRFAMLTSADDKNVPPYQLSFSCALARQCFINEYVFSQSAEEVKRSLELRGRISAELAKQKSVAPHRLAAYASYFPLNSLPSFDMLQRTSWPPVFQAIIAQQVSEPMRELQLRESIPSLTEINDEVSRKVRDQYEENPYPRWNVIESPPSMITVDEFLRSKFPLARFKTPTRKLTDFLVAGCGTGKGPIGCAKLFRGVNILAVDLSLASLAYAKRMSEMLGLKNIEFSQADINLLPAIPRTFDVITSTGVLHHMADPFRAWRGLLSMLRPGGFMHVGLYSELARERISQAWKFIADRGYGQTAAEIRRCREDIIGLLDGEPTKKMTLSSDFYSLSDCRDMLFHSHELRLTLPQIKQFLAENELDIIGFDIPNDILKKYGELFPADLAKTNLDNWARFEKKYPHTFGNMYVFWVQKRESMVAQ
jgi:SAM-dependent methyltransferase